MDSFANRVVLVTGAGNGLGRQLALTLAERGATIAAVDLKPEGLTALEAALPGRRVATAVADVTDRVALRESVGKLAARVGPIDVLIANAGIGLETSALSFRAEDVEAQIRVNLIGVANSIDAVLPSMLERQQGHLVAISSLASYRGLPKMAGYCASKAGVSSLMEAVRIELRPKGIHVTTICPGWIRTALTENIRVPKPYLLEVEDAAGRIVDAIDRRRTFVAFPRPARWRVTLLRWLPPDLSDWAITRLLRSAKAATAAPTEPPR